MRHDTTDEAVRARVEGRMATERRTAWEIRVVHLRARCLRQADGSYVVQVRDAKGWNEEIARGTDAAELLRKFTGTTAVAHLLGAFTGA